MLFGLFSAVDIPVHSSQILIKILQSIFFTYWINYCVVVGVRKDLDSILISDDRLKDVTIPMGLQKRLIRGGTKEF